MSRMDGCILWLAIVLWLGSIVIAIAGLLNGGSYMGIPVGNAVAAAIGCAIVMWLLAKSAYRNRY